MRIFQKQRNNILLISGLFTLLILFNRLAFADAFEQIRKNAATIKTIQADFVQNKSMKILSKPLISEGRFYYVAPDSFRWEYLKPLKSIVINHKGKTKRYIYSGGKMIEDQTGGAQAMKIILNEITSWMNGKFDQNPSFQATIKEGAFLEITLAPVGKNMEGMIEKIIVIISKRDSAVRSVNIIESANSLTRIDFKNTVNNRVIPESIFQDVE